MAKRRRGDRRDYYGADWIHTERFYYVEKMGWVSSDGDEWFNGFDGSFVRSPQFKRAIITFYGGPRSGEQVA